MGIGVIGAEGDGLAVHLRRLFNPALLQQGVAQVVVGFGEFRIQPNRLAMSADRFVDPGELGEDQSPVVVEIRTGRISRDGAIDQFQPALGLALLGQQCAQEVQRIGVVGVLLENLAINLLGRVQFPGRVKPHGFLQLFVKRWLLHGVWFPRAMAQGRVRPAARRISVSPLYTIMEIP